MKKAPKPPYKLWGGRFKTSAGAILNAFSQSLAFDYRLAQADIQGTKVYARVLQHAGILSRAETAPEFVLSVGLITAQSPGSLLKR